MNRRRFLTQSAGGVAAAAVTSERGPLGCRVMEAGKDHFVDKAP